MTGFLARRRRIFLGFGAYKKTPLIIGVILIRGLSYPVFFKRKSAGGGNFADFGLLARPKPFRKRVSGRGKSLENTKKIRLRRACLGTRIYSDKLV